MEHIIESIASLIVFLILSDNLFQNRKKLIWKTDYQIYYVLIKFYIDFK